MASMKDSPNPPYSPNPYKTTVFSRLRLNYSDGYGCTGHQVEEKCAYPFSFYAPLNVSEEYSGTECSLHGSLQMSENKSMAGTGMEQA